MKNRVWVTAVVVALVAGLIGYLLGSNRSSAPTALGSAIPAAVSCDNWLTLTYANGKLTLDNKSLTLDYPSKDPVDHAVCWKLDVTNGGFPFSDLRLDIHDKLGVNNRPVLAGSVAFSKKRLEVFTIFNDEPNWPASPAPQEVKVAYEVVAKIGGTEIPVDPDIIIRKPG